MDEGKEEEGADVLVEEEQHGREGFTVLHQMRERGEMVDVSLVAGGVTLSAHRLVLAAVSPYFRAMFRDWADHGQQVRSNYYYVGRDDI